MNFLDIPIFPIKIIDSNNEIEELKTFAIILNSENLSEIFGKSAQIYKVVSHGFYS